MVPSACIWAVTNSSRFASAPALRAFRQDTPNPSGYCEVASQCNPSQTISWKPLASLDVSLNTSMIINLKISHNLQHLGFTSFPERDRGVIMRLRWALESFDWSPVCCLLSSKVWILSMFPKSAHAWDETKWPWKLAGSDLAKCLCEPQQALHQSMNRILSSGKRHPTRIAHWRLMLIDVDWCWLYYLWIVKMQKMQSKRSLSWRKNLCKTVLFCPACLRPQTGFPDLSFLKWMAQQFWLWHAWPFRNSDRALSKLSV